MVFNVQWTHECFNEYFHVLCSQELNEMFSEGCIITLDGVMLSYGER